MRWNRGRPSNTIPQTRHGQIVRGGCYLRGGYDCIAGHHRRHLSITRRNYWTGFRPAAAPVPPSRLKELRDTTLRQGRLISPEPVFCTLWPDPRSPEGNR